MRLSKEYVVMIWGKIDKKNGFMVVTMVIWVLENNYYLFKSK